jgi:hypothetical protein
MSSTKLALILSIFFHLLLFLAIPYFGFINFSKKERPTASIISVSKISFINSQNFETSVKKQKKKKVNNENRKNISKIIEGKNKDKKIVKNLIEKKEELPIKELKKKLEEENNKSEEENNKEELFAKKPIYNPLPDIPINLRKVAFQSEAVALFQVSKDGIVKNVKLIKPSANPKLNFLLIKSLKKWQFEKSEDEFFQEIKVNFKVI